MPRPESNRKKAKGAAAKAEMVKAAPTKGGSKPKAKPKLSAGELLDKAQHALAFDQFDAAKDFLRRAVQAEPGNLEVLEALGALLAEVGPAEEAVQVLRRAVELSPDQGHEKYMYLGQLLEEEEALEATQKGVQLLDAAAQQAEAGEASTSGGGGGGEGGAAELRGQLCSALCALAEMQLAAGGGEAGPSEEVEALLRRAQEASPSSPEPLQALASLRYEQGRPDEALALLKQSMLLWFVPRAEDISEEGEGMEDSGDEGSEELPVVVKPTTMSEGGSDEDDEGEDEDEEGPSFEFRFEAAKLLLELEETTDTAVQVLEDLIAESDGVPEVWHLLGLAYYSGGHLEEAEEVTEHGVKLMREQGVDAEDEVALSFADLQAAIADARGAGAA